MSDQLGLKAQIKIPVTAEILRLRRIDAPKRAGVTRASLPARERLNDVIEHLAGVFRRAFVSERR